MMGAGPSGLAGMNLTTGEIKYIVSVPFQIGHIQTNPWMPGEIVFAGKPAANRPNAPGRLWPMEQDYGLCTLNRNTNG